MLKRLLKSGLFATALVAPALAGAQGADGKADTLLVGGKVYTPQGWSQAVAMRGGEIVAVGSDAAVMKWRGAGTKVVLLGGKTVLPGLHDMHVHPLGAGRALGQCRFEYGATPEAIFAAVAACAKALPAGDWVVGGRWQAVSFGERTPNRQMLDAIAPNHPVSLTDISGHSLWLNSLALKLAGITRDTPDPEGGRIERDASGEPTGLLRETARDVVARTIPLPKPEQNAAALDRALGIMLSHGVTSLVDATVTREGLHAYSSLADQGKLKQRVRGCIRYTGDQIFAENLQHHATYARTRFKPDCVKVYEDGVPTESKTAAMLEPYVHEGDDHGAPGERGFLLVPPEELNPLVTRLDKQGITVKFHAAGDWAARTALDAVAAARKANGMGGPTHDVGHLTFIDPADLARARGINATLEFSPYLWFPSPINDDIIKVSGQERIKRVWPVREGIDSGALVVVGSDWSVVPSANPWIGIETLVTRRAPAGEREGEVYGTAEAITLKEAIDLFTVNGARQMGKGDRLGTIEKGKIADLIVLDRNPFEIPATDLHKVVVEQAFIEGEKVYEFAKTAG